MKPKKYSSDKGPYFSKKRSTDRHDYLNSQFKYIVFALVFVLVIAGLVECGIVG